MKTLLFSIILSLTLIPILSVAQTDAEREQLKEEIRQEMLREEIRKELVLEREKEKERALLEQENATLEAEKKALEEEVKSELDEEEQIKKEIKKDLLEEVLTIEEAISKAAASQAKWDVRKAEAEQVRIDSMDYTLSLPVLEPKMVIYDTLRVRAVNGKIADGPARGYQMVIYRAKERDVASGWKQYIKGYKGRLDSKNRDDEYFVDDVFIPSISNVNMDITTTMEEVKGDIVMTSYFDMGGVYLSDSQNSEAAKSAKKLLKQFGVEQMKEVIEDELKGEEKELEKIEKDFSQLRKKNVTIHDQILNLKEQIAAQEISLQENLNEQDKSVARTRAQQTEVRRSQMKRNGVE